MLYQERKNLSKEFLEEFSSPESLKFDLIHIKSIENSKLK